MSTDTKELLETARRLADDHIHGYDYHIYTVLCDALDVAADEIEQLTRAQRECSDTCCELEDQIESLEQLVRDLWESMRYVEQMNFIQYEKPEHRERIERLTNENTS